MSRCPSDVTAALPLSYALVPLSWLLWTATLYFALRQPKAARVYLESVIVEYPDTVWARAALLDKARSFAAEGSRALAEGEYQRLMELYPETEEARTAATEKAALSG